jgi:hypothetical protein
VSDVGREALRAAGYPDSEPPVFAFREFRVTRLDGPPQTVIGLVIGPLGIARAQSGEWRVCHLATGGCVCRLAEWDDAALAAALLARETWPEDPASDAALGDRVRAVVAVVDRYAFDQLVPLNGGGAQ